MPKRKFKILESTLYMFACKKTRKWLNVMIIFIRSYMKLIIIGMLFDVTSSFVNENNGYSLIGCYMRQAHRIRSEIHSVSQRTSIMRVIDILVKHIQVLSLSLYWSFLVFPWISPYGLLLFRNYFWRNISSHFSQILRSLESWSLGQTWTMGGFIIYSVYWNHNGATYTFL